MYPKFLPAGTTTRGYFNKEKSQLASAKGASEVTYMPTSKKQMVKLNQAKKAKAEELSKQAAGGSKEAQKKLKKLEKKLK